MSPANANISQAEFDVLKTLWERGPSTVRELGLGLRARRRRWAYTTTQTLLNRLESKGYVACERTSIPHVFKASVTRERLMRQRLRSLANDLCDGAVSPLIIALVRERKFSSDELDQLRQLLDTKELEATG